MRRVIIGVNRLLTEEVERIFYQKVDMSKLRSRQHFVAALEADRRRAAYVHALVLDSEDSISHRGLVLFHTFSNMRSLTIHHKFASGETLTALKRCRFPHLTHFASSCSLNDLSFRVFLSRHPTLKSLGLRKSFSMAFGMPTSFPATLLPKLEDLDGHWSNVVRLVEGRPVSQVTVRSANAASYVSRHKLAVILPIMARSVSGAGVRRLTVHVQDADAELVAMVAQSLPSLLCLNLVDSSFGGATTDEAIQDMRALHVVQALSQFDALEEFGVDWPTPDVSRQHIGVIASNNPSLRRLAFYANAWRRANGEAEWEPERL